MSKTIDQRVAALEERVRALEGAVPERWMAGKELAGLREKAGLSLRAAGLLLGVSHVTVHEWESGKTTISEERALHIRKVLG